VPPEVEQQIADLRGSGVGANDLARRFHLHRGTVWACVQRARARADMGGVA
jgi:DNA-binding CsgD family transcriptional regulator